MSDRTTTVTSKDIGCQLSILYDIDHLLDAAKDPAIYKYAVKVSRYALRAFYDELRVEMFAAAAYESDERMKTYIRTLPLDKQEAMCDEVNSLIGSNLIFTSNG
jgi:hypothetical protein